MKLLSKYWNLRIGGLFHLSYLIVSILFNLLLRRIYSFIYLSNIAESGSNNIIYGKVNIRYPGNIHLKNNIKIDKNVSLTSEMKNGKLIIDDNSWVGRKTSIDFSGGVEIGKNVTISESCLIESHDHGLNPRSKPIPQKLIIEDDVWLAARSTILQKVNVIGKGSIVASGSTVTKDVPPGVIVAGIPAKIIKEL